MLSIVFAIILWSSLGIIIRLSGAPVIVLILYAALISAVLTGTGLLKPEYRRGMPKGRGLLPFLVLGPLSLLNTFSFFYAYRYTSIANAVLTHYTAPIFVAFLAPVFLRERLTGRTLLAVGISTAGLWLLLGLSGGEFLEKALSGDRETGGILAGLLSGLAYAVLIIVFRVFSQNAHPVVMTFFQNSVITLVLLPFKGMPAISISTILVVLVMGIVHSTIAPILYFRGMAKVTANRAAILGYLEPVCAIILGTLFPGERMGLQSIIGGAMILGSGYLTIRAPEGNNAGT